MRSRLTLATAAEARTLFDLTQDDEHRLHWDPFLREARLVDADRPAVGVLAWCVAWCGIGMESRYVSYRPPEVCAVVMTREPWFLRSFAGSWRFLPLGQGRTRVDFTYHVVGRPRWLTPWLGLAFRSESWRRLAALKKATESR